jgi:hypothetical protein
VRLVTAARNSALALLFSLACLVAPPAAAQDEMSEAEAFVASNIIHILLHEIGHAVIDRFALPVIGQEEDAADSFATLEVLTIYDDDVDILLDSAEAMLIMHDLAEAGGTPLDYFGVHDLDIQRGLRIVCHAVGIDPDRYDEAARWTEMDPDQQAACEIKAETAIESWDVLLEPYLREEGASAPPAPVTLEDSALPDMRAFLADSGIMTDLALYVGETFRWPQVPALVAADCGEANAWYDPDTVEITLCYEFIDELFALAEQR